LTGHGALVLQVEWFFALRARLLQGAGTPLLARL
jgi:hypothetical protein